MPLAAAALAVSGCAAGVDAQRAREADPVFVVRILPTRPGLIPLGPTRTIDRAAYARAVLGHDDPALTANLAEAGLQRAAVREWTGPGGARLVAVAGLWDDGSAAVALNGEAAENDVPGPDATPWTPSDFGGSRGARSPRERALSMVVGKASLFVRAEGPVTDAMVIRTIDLMQQAAAAEDR